MDHTQRRGFLSRGAGAFPQPQAKDHAVTSIFAEYRDQRLARPAARIPRDPAARDHGWPDRWPHRTQLELAALDTAPACGRAHVGAVLHEWQASPDLTDTAVLVASELLTNAVLSTQAHDCPDPVRLWMLGNGSSVLLLTWDATMPAPVLAATAPDGERGRGLALVAALCDRWGFYYPVEHPGGKVVWALMKPGVPQ